MSVQENLYKDIILSYGKKKDFFLDDPPEEGEYSFSAVAVNATCGDEIEEYMNTEENKVTDFRYSGMGCTICMASAAMLADYVTGKNLEEASKGIDLFEGFLNGKDDSPFPPDSPLSAMGSVRKYPVRVRCALLPWKAAADLIRKS